jgi:hypothetical protein
MVNIRYDLPEYRSQSLSILLALKRGKGAVGLTAIDALERYGCFRLAARIYDLREEGHKIKTRFHQRSGKRIAEYFLA